jgi:hypothetical protein
MTLPGRFAEYGLSGAFFWICQLILLLLFGRTEFIINLLSMVPLSSVGAAPQLVQTLVASLLAVLAIIAIFTTGLLLDLCAAYFILWEISVFKQHLDRNASWLIGLIERYKEYSADDYQQLHDHFGNSFFSKEAWLEALRLHQFWQRGWYRRYLAAQRQGFRRWALVEPYTRLSSFLMSYVIIQSGSSQLSVLTDLISQWRVGRALSTAMIFIVTEIFLGIVIWLTPLSISSFITRILPPLLLALIAFFVLSTLPIRSLYSRVCHTLFSLVYVTQQKESSRPTSPEVPKP